MDNIDNQFLTTYAETEAWLKKMGIENYTINDDLTVDVNKSVFIHSKDLKYFPVQFKKISGDFYCYSNNFQSFKGCPKTIGRSFFCHDNPLTDFSYLEFDVRGNIIFTPPKNMDYVDSYKNTLGNVEINFNEFKKLQSLKNLENKLNEDLSNQKDNCVKKFKI